MLMNILICHGKKDGRLIFGMIYILFGPPDEIQRSNLNSSNSSAYQVWYYNRINKQFIFKDQNGFGDYRLDRPFIGSNY